MRGFLFFRRRFNKPLIRHLKYWPCVLEIAHIAIFLLSKYTISSRFSLKLYSIVSETFDWLSDEVFSMKFRTWLLTLSFPKEHRFLCGILCWSFLALPLAAQMGGMGGMGRRGWGGGNFASTAQQGADYGMASMMRAQGYQNLQNSEAAKNFQSAQSQQIDNRKKWTETYFDMRKTNRKARADEAPSRISH